MANFHGMYHVSYTQTLGEGKYGDHNITLDYHHVSRKHAVLVGGWQAVSMVPMTTKMLIQSMSSMHFISRHKASCTSWQRKLFISLTFPCDIIYTQQVFTDCLRSCSITWYVEMACRCWQKIIITHETCTSQSVMQTKQSWRFHASIFSCLLGKNHVYCSVLSGLLAKNFMVKLYTLMLDVRVRSGAFMLYGREWGGWLGQGLYGHGMQHAAVSARGLCVSLPVWQLTRGRSKHRRRRTVTADGVLAGQSNELTMEATCCRVWMCKEDFHILAV